MTLLEPLRRPFAQILAPCLATHAKRWGLVREPPTRTVHFGMIFSEEACKCPNCPTCNGEHDVARFNTGLLGRSSRRHADDDDLVLGFGRIRPEPGPRRPIRPPKPRHASRIGVSRSIGTIMLSGRVPPPGVACWSWSEPMPNRSPPEPIRAVPPHSGWSGAVKIASSSKRYSQ
jgi:hypothetical protein